MSYRNHAFLALLLSLISLPVGAVEAIGSPTSSTTAPTTPSATAPATPSTSSSSSRLDSDEQRAERKKEKERLELQSSKTARRGNAPCLTWLPSSEKPKAVILCVHGLGLHNGTYADFGKRMAGLGYAVYAIDVRGFGSFIP